MPKSASSKLKSKKAEAPAPPVDGPAEANKDSDLSKDDGAHEDVGDLETGEGKEYFLSKDGEDSDEEEDSDDDGVDEEGMTRLMQALGEDCLDDFDRSHLALLLGDHEDDEDDSDEDEDKEGGIETGGNDEAVDEDEMESTMSGSDATDVDADRDEGYQDRGEVGAHDEDNAAIALDEVDEVDEDAVPRQKIQINDTVALDRIYKDIRLDPSLPWTETLAVTYPETIDVDVDDDLNRELALSTAHSLATKHQLPFTRPADYFAEMVKTDAHMERIRQRLLDEQAGIKKGEEKRREREGKKFGKQVQVEKLKERERSKKEMEERLKGLKRKRKDMLDTTQEGDDAFDVAVEDAISDRPAKRGKSTAAGGSKMSRQARDSKFGFGGVGRRSKQNTRGSTDDFNFSRGSGRAGSGRGRGGKRGGAQRLGKSRRMAARSKK
ncbi:Ebp2-domain-containing protein [Fistulina hepatica ATCC 64428]|uniref:Ebp2-domain-containing protein n=1 Tax=Fistulina hepatica ATCC 64428 TaxID=1128425 RepID=A0A0D7AL92_9AGAR|nr:Ebp2-domain-containing protein [Fistulina hepatica ATCC 64428]